METLNHQDSQTSLSNGDVPPVHPSISQVALVKSQEADLQLPLSVNSDKPTSSGGSATRSATSFGWKNALALSFGWLFLYSGYLPMNSIQSSLNGDDGLGTASLSVQNAMEMIGNLFLSSYIINRIGNKWTVAIGSFLFSAYIAANFYPAWATLIPTAALAGLGASMTWIAQNTYMTKLSQYVASRTGVDYHTVNVRFFGTFYSIYYSSNVVGNVVSSFLLGADFIPDNETLSYDPMTLCGANYCNEDLGTYFHPGEEDEPDLGVGGLNVTDNSRGPEQSQVYALCGFCLTSTILATVLFSLLVDPLSSMGISEASEGGSSSLQLLSATFRHLKDPNQLLVLPLTFYNGLDNDFIYNEFTKAFVTCPLGIEYIGFVTACFGVFGPISSLVSGWISSKRTRFVPFLVAGVAHISSGIIMLYWNPAAGSAVSVYVMSAVWGIGSGVWCSQLNAFYGIIFPNTLEAAFSNFHLWNSIASTTLYATSYSVCTVNKIYVMLGVVSLGLIGYTIVSIRLHLQSKRKKDKEEEEEKDYCDKKDITLTNMTKVTFE